MMRKLKCEMFDCHSCDTQICCPKYAFTEGMRLMALFYKT